MTDSVGKGQRGTHDRDGPERTSEH
jgi:hypothetical protein